MATWDLRGNGGTNPTTDFLGTTDDRPVIIKINNNEAVRINSGDVNVTGTVHAQNVIALEIIAVLGSVNTGGIKVGGVSSDDGQVSDILTNIIGGPSIPGM